MNVGRAKGDSFRRAFFACRDHPTAEATVGVHGGTDVPSLAGVTCPRFAFFGVLVNKDARANGCDWCPIEVEGTEDLSVR